MKKIVTNPLRLQFIPTTICVQMPETYKPINIYWILSNLYVVAMYRLTGRYRVYLFSRVRCVVFVNPTYHKFVIEQTRWLCDTMVFLLIFFYDKENEGGRFVMMSWNLDYDAPGKTGDKISQRSTKSQHNFCCESDKKHFFLCWISDRVFVEILTNRSVDILTDFLTFEWRSQNTTHTRWTHLPHNK